MAVSVRWMVCFFESLLLNLTHPSTKKPTLFSIGFLWNIGYLCTEYSNTQILMYSPSQLLNKYHPLHFTERTGGKFVHVHAAR